MVIPFFIEMPVLKNPDNRHVYLVIEIIATKMFYHSRENILKALQSWLYLISFIFSHKK